jgi:hypothetical protein
MTVANIPTAAGKLNVTWGKRAACTDFSARCAAFCADFGCLAGMLNSVPHTKQRAAFSLKRVPHVGQTLVLLDEEGSILMGEDYIILEKERSAK